METIFIKQSADTDRANISGQFHSGLEKNQEVSKFDVNIEWVSILFID